MSFRTSKASAQVVGMEDVAAARRAIGQHALSRVPNAIVRSLMWSVFALVALWAAAWFWLTPARLPASLLAPSTLWLLVCVFFTPWPLVLIFGDYQDQRALLNHIARRLQGGEHIPMPPGGVLKVPILINEDAQR